MDKFGGIVAVAHPGERIGEGARRFPKGTSDAAAGLYSLGAVATV
jgi:hypothetical protein